MSTIILTAWALGLSIASITLLYAGTRFYFERSGILAYAGLPVMLGGLAVGYAASIASLGAAMRIFGAS